MAVYKTDVGLQGLWLMEEASGARADYTANNNDLTDNNTVTSSADVQEGALSADFESANSESLSIADGSQTGLDITGSLTICLWVKPESTPATDRTFVSKFVLTGNQRQYILQVLSTGEIDCILSPDGTSGTTRATGASTLGTGAWKHIAAVYNGTDIRLYIDGAVDTNGTDNPKAYTGGIFNGTGTFRIGAFGNTASEFYDGLMDEVAIFNRPLSATEIDDIYNNGIQDPPAVTFPTTAVLDDFNRADTASLGANWLHTYAAGQGAGFDGGISSNQAYNPDSGTAHPLYYTAAQYGPDCEVYVTMPVLPPAGSSVFVGARIGDVGGVGYSGYMASILVGASGNDEFEIYRVDAGIATLLSSTYIADAADSSAIGMEIRGSTITMFYKVSGGSWLQIMSVTDATYASAGYLLLNLPNDGAARYDNFGGGTVGGHPIMKRWGGIPGLNQYTGRKGW
jgi:hypothetical protein